jgi:hypothetical protein
MNFIDILRDQVAQLDAEHDALRSELDTLTITEERSAEQVESRADEILIRSTAIAQKISHATNLAAAEASVEAIRALKSRELTVKSIQEYHGM